MELAAGIAVGPNLRLVRELGRGGMGSVWVADHLTLDTQVAVKFISSALLGREGVLERFGREAKMAARVKSPHLVQIFDHGVMDGGTPYIVMELLAGESLAERVAGGRTLTLREVVALVDQLARALTSAHRLGVVHRDLKPENVFLVEQPGAPRGELFVKLLDFGVARSFDGSDTSGVTQAGAVVGTPAYMSPEQLSDSTSVGASADLWSLTVVTYRALLGRLPFAGQTPVALWTSIAARSFARPSSVAPALPPALDGWFERALRIEPADRFPSAHAMADALRAIAAAADPAAITSPGLHAEGTSSSAAASSELATVDFVGSGDLGLAIDAGHAGAAPGPATAAARAAAYVTVGEAPTQAAAAPGPPGTAGAPLPSAAAARTPSPHASTPGAAATGGGTVGGAAATIAPSVGSTRGRRAWPFAVVGLAGAAALAWVALRGTATSAHDGAATATSSADTAPVASSPSGSGILTASGAPEPTTSAPALREPTLGLKALADYRDPKGASVVNLRSASLWNAAAQDFAEAAAQQGAPARWRAAQLFAEAERAYVQGDYAAAGTSFRAATEADESWPLAHEGLATALSEQGDLAAALGEAERAQRLDPTWWNAVACAGRAYSAAGRSDEAIQEFRRALELAPANPVLLAEVALAYHAAHNDPAADRYADEALRLDPDLVSVHVMRAERALERSDGKTALDEASRAIAVAPKSLAGKLAEADALALLGRRDDALAAYARVLELVAENGRAGAPKARLELVEKLVAQKALPPGRAAAPERSRAKPAAPTQRADPPSQPDSVF